MYNSVNDVVDGITSWDGVLVLGTSPHQPKLLSQDEKPYVRDHVSPPDKDSEAVVTVFKNRKVQFWDKWPNIAGASTIVYKYVGERYMRKKGQKRIRQLSSFLFSSFWNKMIKCQLVRYDEWKSNEENIDVFKFLFFNWVCRYLSGASKLRTRWQNDMD